MPDYTTTDLVQQVLSRTWGETGDTAADLSEEVLGRAISEAQAEIDARLRGVYVVPFNPVPELIGIIATAIAAYSADLTYREIRDYNSDLNPVLLRYNRAKMLLGQLASGELDLPPEVPPADTGVGGGVIVFARQYDTLFDDPSLFQMVPVGCGCVGFCSCWWGSPEMWGIR